MAAVEFMIGGIASCIAEAATLPFDTLKVRMQIEPNTSFFPMFIKILKNEGYISFFNGIEPAIIRQIFYGSMRYGFYPLIKNLLNARHIKNAFMHKFLSGLLTGAISSALANPTDLIKIRMQGSSKARDSKLKRSHRYKNFVDAFITIIKNEGFLALYTGILPTIVRASVIAAVEMSVYETIKLYISEVLEVQSSSVIVHIISALIASCLSSLASCPFDMARSRVMNQPVRRDGVGALYKGPFHCLYISVKQEGVLVLWAGFWALLLRLVPNTVLTFMIMEQLRILFSLFIRQ